MEGEIVRAPTVDLLFRDAELASAKRFFETGHESNASRLLLLVGDSGTGKTTFLKRLLASIGGSDPDALVAYVDLYEDEFTTANLLESLVSLCWNHQERRTSPQLVCIPHNSSFSDFIRRRKVKRAVVRHLYHALRHSAGLVPGVKGALDALPDAPFREDSKTLSDAELPEAFCDYLGWVCRRHCHVYLAVDNYQFLQHRVRLMLESRLGAISSNLRLILVDRLREGKTTIQDPTCFPSCQLKLELKEFSKPQTKTIVRTRGDLSEEEVTLVSRDCYLKTAGNPKEVELYLRRIPSARQGPTLYSQESLIDTIESLPMLARSVILLTSMFTAGLKRRYVESTLRKLAARTDTARVNETLSELVALGYIVINGANGETVRAAHERIVRAMRDSVTEDELLEIRQLVVLVLDQAITEDLNHGEYFYVLHCLIGVLHLNEALNHIEHVIQLIVHQHGGAKFDYVASIFGTNPKLVASLPALAVRLVLDALQKTSQFALGQVMLRELQETGFEEKELLLLFDAKYQVQMYQPLGALEALHHVEQSPVRMLVELNALLCLCRDDEARLLVAELERHENREELYIALRNSAHLFPLEQALDNLMRAHEFFKSAGKRFLLATVLNNQGVVYAWAGTYVEARRTLLRAQEIMTSIGSREVYQSSVNLAAQAAVAGDVNAAVEFLSCARKAVPRELLLDRLMIDANEAVILHHFGRQSRNQTLATLRQIYLSALTISDPRLHDALATSYSALLEDGPNDEGIEPSERFQRQLRERKHTGFEISLGPNKGATNLTTLLILSPHWRH